MSLSLGISAGHFVVPSVTIGPDAIGLSVMAAALDLLGVPRGNVAGDDRTVAEDEVPYEESPAMMNEDPKLLDGTAGSAISEVEKVRSELLGESIASLTQLPTELTADNLSLQVCCPIGWNNTGQYRPPNWGPVITTYPTTRCIFGSYGRCCW